MNRPTLWFPIALAVALLAADFAERVGGTISDDIFAEAVRDFMPPQETHMIRFMEMLAVFETSRRSLLPERFRHLTPDEVQERLAQLRRATRE